eukprot:SAG31_NODE_389_length_16370_cov_4.517915_10_plen_74_part_00
MHSKTARTDETVQESKYLMSKIDAEKTLELQTLESKRDENLQKYKFMAIKEKKSECHFILRKYQPFCVLSTEI